MPTTLAGRKQQIVASLQGPQATALSRPQTQLPRAVALKRFAAPGRLSGALILRRRRPHRSQGQALIWVTRIRRFNRLSVALDANNQRRFAAIRRRQLSVRGMLMTGATSLTIGVANRKKARLAEARRPCKRLAAD